MAQPGMAQPGALQPGAPQPGYPAQQPGAMQPAQPGAMQPGAPYPAQPGVGGDLKPVQPKMKMAIICWFLGGFGIHRMMMGYSNWWLMLLTCGGCGIWTIIDLIKIFTGKMGMADGRPLEG